MKSKISIEGSNALYLNTASILEEAISPDLAESLFRETEQEDDKDPGREEDGKLAPHHIRPLSIDGKRSLSIIISYS
jgi:hypothetical protein